MATPLIEPRGLRELRRNLSESRGLDLAHYSDSFLERRLLIRMRHHQIETLSDYIALLSRDGGEYQRLLDALSINVTGFFRDAELSEAALQAPFAKLLAREGAAPARPIQVWSAGCATGQEAYTLAMLLDTYLSRNAPGRRYQVCATDVNEEHLAAAREGRYPKAAAATIPPTYQARYVVDEGERFRVADSIRRHVQFQRHDLSSESPLAPADVVVCRNVMIYFSLAAKNRIVEKFHRSLNPGGLMILGSAEIVLRSGLFEPASAEHKFYWKKDAGREAS